jgi:stage II sporulation protein D
MPGRTARFVFAIVLAALLASASAGATVRVLLALVPSATVVAEGAHSGRIDGAPAFSTPTGLSWPVGLERGKLVVDGHAIGTSLQLSGTVGAPLRFQGRRYRGSIELIAHQDGIEVINVVNVEAYLRGVVPAEMSASWPMAALKAQAVAARSYAISLAGAHGDYDLCAGVSCQVYRGMDAENARSDEAVRATDGIVVTYDGRIARTYYFADSGGVTASSDEVWGKSVPYLVARPDAVSPTGGDRWRVTLAPGVVEASLSRLGIGVGTVTGLQVLGRSQSGRVDRLAVVGTAGSATLSRTQLEAVAGRWGLKSMRFTLAGPLSLDGEGWGHGVGMSQDGARLLAEQGYDYTQILGYYYPHTRLVRYLYGAAAAR